MNTDDKIKVVLQDIDNGSFKIKSTLPGEPSVC